MGIIPVQGPISGRTYDVKIAGDAPTAEEIARADAMIAQQEQAFSQQYSSMVGGTLVPDDGTAVGRGIDRAKTGLYSSLGTVLRDTGDALDFDWLQGVGEGMESSAQRERLREAVELPDPTRLDDVNDLSSGLTFLGEALGQSIPEMGATLGATAVGTLAGGPVAGLAAGMATATPLFYGRNIELQEEQIAAGLLAEKSRLDAFLAAGGAAALNTVGDKLLLTGKLFGLNVPLSKNLFVRSAQFAGAGAATEIPTEITQQVLERAQAGLPLDDDEAIKEYIEVGVAAGLIGGTVGGVSGPFRSPGAPALSDADADADTEAEAGAGADATPAPLALPSPDSVPMLLTPDQRVYGTSGTLALPSPDSVPMLLTPDQRVNFTSDAYTRQPELFADLPAARAPDPLLLSPDQRVGKQLEMDLSPPFPLRPEYRTDAQGELNLVAPEGTQSELFGAAPPVGRPAKQVLDELGVAPLAPIRKRLATAVDTDPRVLDELRRYARTPGVSRETRLAVEDYIARADARTVPVVSEDTNAQAEQADLGGAGDSVSADTQRVADEESGGGRDDTGEPAASDEAGLGEPVPDTEPSAEAAAEESDAVEEPSAAEEPGAVEEPPAKARKSAKAQAKAAAADAAKAAKGAAAQVTSEARPNVEEPPAPEGGKRDEEPDTADLPGMTPAQYRNSIGEGRTLGTAEQDIPDAIPPVAGREPVSAQAQRQAELDEIITNQDAITQELEEIAATLGSRRTLQAIARSEGTKPENIRKNLRRRKLRLEADLYRAKSALRKHPAAAKPKSGAKAPEATSAQIAAWHANNAPKAVADYDAETRDPSGTDITTSADRGAILSLLSMTPTQRKKNAQANAAFQYFSKTRNPTDALENMAYDVASPDAPKRRVASKKTPLEPYYAGTGKTAAEKARAWVNNTLSEDTQKALENRAGFYAKDNFAAQSDAIDAAIKTSRAEAEQRADYARPEVDTRRKTQQRAAAVEDMERTQGGESYTKEELRQMRERDADRIGSDLDAELDDFRATTGIQFAQAPSTPAASVLYGTGAPLHPSVTRALRSGNLDAALRGLAATNADPRVAKLASKLRKFVGSTRVRVMERSDPEISILQQDDGQFSPGAYIHEFSSTYAGASQATRELMRGRTNTILIDAETGLNAHTVLHEMTHAATAKELDNKSSPTRARLVALLKDARAHFDRTQSGADVEPYGLTDVYEFLAETMSNPEFRAFMSGVYPNKTRASWLMQALNHIENFVRTRVLGMKARDIDSALAEVDVLTRSILAPAPQFRTSLPLSESAVRPLKAREALSSVGRQAKDFDKAEAKRIAATLKDKRLPSGVRRFIYDTAVPFRNLADYARENFPVVDRAYQLVTEHAKAIDKRNEMTRETIDRIALYFKEAPKMVDVFNEFRTMASFYEVDVRRGRAAYSKYTLKYTPMDAQGLPKAPVFESFNTKDERDLRLAELNVDVPATRSKARVANDPDETTLKTFDYLNDLYKQLDDRGKQEYVRILALFSALHRETAKVYKARLEAMLPGQEALQRSLYKDIFDKLFAENNLIVYQPLQRAGDFWLTFTAKDPVTNTSEPFKMSFESRKARDAYQAQLRALPAEAGVVASSIQESVKVPKFRRVDGAPPTAFVAKIAQTLRKDADAKGEAARKEALARGETAEQAEVAAKEAREEATTTAAEYQKQITELALDMMPERSFLQAYKKRQGYQGMLFGADPTGAKVSPQDTIDMLLRKTTSLNRQLADMEYSAKAVEVRRQLDEQFEEGITDLPANQHENLKAQYMAIDRALGNVFVRRSPLVSKANSLTFAMTLGMNISSPVMNFMSIPTIIAPYLAATPGYGPRATARAFSHALKVLSGSGRKRSVEIIGTDGKLQTVQKDAGRFGYSMRNYDFGNVDHSTGYARGDNALNKYAYLQQVGEDRHLFADSTAYDYLEVQELAGHGFWDKFNRWSGAMMHYSEQAIRESTLIAAYDLELRKIAKAKGSDVLTEAEMRGAAETAAYTTEKTNGTIPAAAAPNNAQGGIMPMIYMFKRYPLGIANLLTQVAAESWPGKSTLAARYGKGTPEYKAALEGRKAARLQLGGMLGSIGLFAGASGLPLYGAMAGIIDTFFRDDDELQTDELVRTAIGELGFKGLANYVLGVEMSSRIGLSGMFYREPLRAADQPPIWNLIEGMGGPAVSIIHGWSTRTMDHVTNGDYYKALESGSPAAMRNALRAMRFATTGAAESSRGDIIQDITPFSVIGQAMGFAPAPYIQQLEINSAAKKIDNAIREKRTKLLRRRNIALRNGDAHALRKADHDIAAFNQRHPHNPITPETKSRSQTTFNNTTEKVINGIVYTDKNRDLLLKTLRDIESPATIFDALGMR